MNPWSIIEFIIDIVIFLSCWRFSVCLIISTVLAFVVISSSIDSILYWIVGGVIVAIGLTIGWCWENKHERTNA
jgi:hypothetical protein